MCNKRKTHNCFSICENCYKVRLILLLSFVLSQLWLIVYVWVFIFLLRVAVSNKPIAVAIDINCYCSLYVAQHINNASPMCHTWSSSEQLFCSIVVILPSGSQKVSATETAEASQETSTEGKDAARQARHAQELSERIIARFRHGIESGVSVARFGPDRRSGTFNHAR